MLEFKSTEQAERSASIEKWRKRFYLLGAIVLFCLVIGISAFAMGVLAMPLGILAWCIVFIFCLYPLVDWFQDKGINRGLGTTLAYVVMFAIIAVVVWVAVSPAVGLSQQFATINQDLPRYFEQFNNWYQHLDGSLAGVLQNGAVQGLIQSLSSSFYQTTDSFSNVLANSIMGLGKFLVDSCVIIGFALVISFWLLMDLPGIRREMRRLIHPDHRDDADVILGTFGSSIGGYIKGTLFQCLIIGAACGISYAVIGVPNAAACGVITGILNIIPVVGPWLGGIMAGGIGLMNSPLVALLAVVAAVIIQQLVYTFVTPIIMRGAVDIHPALMIFALMCGSAIGQYMGGLVGNIVGMLLAIPLTAAAKSLFVYFYEKRTERKIVAPDGVFFKGEVSEGDTAHPEADAAAPVPQPQASKELPFIHHYPSRHPSDEQRQRDSARKERNRQLRLPKNGNRPKSGK